MSMSGSMVSIGVPGLSVTPAFLPSARIVPRAVHVRARFHMHGDDVAGVGKGLEIRIAGCDHEVHVEHLPGVRAKRLDHAGADRDVRHEMPIHDVDMDPVGTGCIDRAHLLAEPGKVGGEYRGCDQERMTHRILQSAVRVTRPQGREQRTRARFARPCKLAGTRRLVSPPSERPLGARTNSRDPGRHVRYCARYTILRRRLRTCWGCVRILHHIPVNSSAAPHACKRTAIQRFGMARVDAIVLGAGIVGNSVGLHLAKRGLAVALVDRRGPGEENLLWQCRGDRRQYDLSARLSVRSAGAVACRAQAFARKPTTTWHSCHGLRPGCSPSARPPDRNGCWRRRG